MADQKPSSNYYSNLGGINQKSSEYSVDETQAHDLRNLDFNIPNAWNKRPGQTQTITGGVSGPVSSLHEFIKLDGSSYVVFGDEVSMYRKVGSGFTVLSSGWTAQQPTDMLTFVNRLFMSNGQRYDNWNGISPVAKVGLPGAGNISADSINNNTGGSLWLIAGLTHSPLGGNTNFVGMIWTYTYRGIDGDMSPNRLFGNIATINSKGSGDATGGIIGGNGATINFFTLNGFTVPAGYGIDGLNLYVGVEQKSSPFSSAVFGPGKDAVLGLGNPRFFGSVRFDANLSNFFYYYTTISSGLTTYTAEMSSWAGFVENASLVNFENFLFFGGFGYSANVFSTADPGYVSDPYIPKYIDVNQNRVTMSGFSSNPSAFWFSEVGAPNSVHAENNIEVRTNDGDKIYGHKTFQNQTIIFKQKSFHKLIGDSNENFELVEVSREYGCISNKSIVEFAQKLAWLDEKGVIVFDGTSYEMISYPIEDTFRRINLSAALERAVGVHYQSRNQIWFGIPVDGATQNNLTLVYDYLVKAWTFFDGFNPSSFALMKQELNLPTVWRGTYSGSIHHFGESFLGDNGSAITCLAFTRFDHQAQNETWIWRRFFLDVIPSSGPTGVILGQAFANYNDTSIQATFTIYQQQFQTRAEMGVVGKAAAAQISHSSASLPLTINGYTWTKRFLRNV